MATKAKQEEKLIKKQTDKDPLRSRLRHLQFRKLSSSRQTWPLASGMAAKCLTSKSLGIRKLHQNSWNGRPQLQRRYFLPYFFFFFLLETVTKTERDINSKGTQRKTASSFLLSPSFLLPPFFLSVLDGH